MTGTTATDRAQKGFRFLCHSTRHNEALPWGHRLLGHLEPTMNGSDMMMTAVCVGFRGPSKSELSPASGRASVAATKSSSVSQER
mmetsp:Transcript_33303/g.84392  ORF Transcript_33303/g.84392 Transcript_33303/m.84392 type:complete len:85 (+) Transcript_33303:297-551(+)